MPHIDDGTLHALLDGALRAMEPAEAEGVEAHLEVCAECRARLQEAAALRGRTGEILDVLEPAIVPDFEEVLVRAGASAAAGGAAAGGAAGRPERLRRQVGWTRGLAWAATLVIALGTGYLIRDRLGPEGTAELMQSTADRVRSSAAEAPGSGAGGDREGGAPGGDAATAPTAGDVAEGRANDARAGQNRQEVRPATPVVTQEQERSRAVGDAPSAEGPVREEAVESRNLQRSRVADGVAADPPEPRLEIAAPAEALKMTDAATAPGSFVAMAPPDTSGLQVVAPTAVRALAGTPLAVIPGAEVVQVWVAAAPASRIVSTQRLEDGAVVRVVQQPSVIALEAVVVTGVAADEERRPRQAAARPRPQEAEAAAAAAPPPAAESTQPGMNRVQTGGILGYELILEGPLPRERLEALARAAREAWIRATLVRPDP